MTTTTRTPTAEPERVDLLTVLTAERGLPPGCDRWAIRSVHPDLRSSHDYRYPWPGQWATAPGDGLSVAHTWAGMASSGIPAITLLLVAYATTDLLSPPDRPTVRLRRVYVVDVVDGARLVRDHGAGADLTGAYLRGAYLAGAYLAGAHLAGAHLAGAHLTRAYLRGADLTGAYLRGADLTGADLTGAYLRGADLTGAYLTGAYLRGADLTGAEYTAGTRWPAGLDPATRGAVLL